MVRGALLHTETDLSFATTNILTSRITLLAADYPEESDRDRFFRDLISRVEAVPGVTKAAIASHLPGVNRWVWHVQMEGVDYDDYRRLPTTSAAAISPEYFETLDVGLLEGRGFTSGDNVDGRPVTIVNRSFAERFFPGESPLGRQIKIVGSISEGDWMTIVGVAPDLGMNRRIVRDADGIYIPYSQQLRSSMGLMLHAHGDPMALVPDVRRVVWSLDPNLPIYDISSLAESISNETIPERLFSVLFICCGAAALALAVVGLYGVMAFMTRRRTKEIGIRMALGAREKRILWLSLRGALAQVLIGLFAGVCLSLVIAPALRDMFDEVSPWDWQIYLTVTLALCFSGMVASLVPALRATRVDPMATLRCE
jgi:putative ABC transport system permease protein